MAVALRIPAAHTSRPGRVGGDRLNNAPTPAPKPPGQGGAGPAPDGLDELYSSPDYLIRRAHQVATAAFTHACADLDLTSSQYAALFALRQHASVGQNELGRLISLDRSTTSVVVRSLRERQLVQAHADESDRRKSFLEITDAGRLLLAKAEQRSSHANQALMSLFDRRQAEDFLAMLRKLSAAFDAPD